MSCHYLSYPLSMNSPRPPAIPAPEISEFLSIKKDDANVQKITFYNHTGTHLDTAAHVIADGVSIEKFSISDLIFTNIAVIELDLPDCHHIMPEDFSKHENKLKNCDMAIFKLGTEKIRKNDHERFSNNMPGFTVCAAEYMRGNFKNLRCLGTDLPSFSVISNLNDTMKAHNTFLKGNENKMLIIEEMKLDDLKPYYEKIMICPWMIENMNSGPCTVIAM